MAERYENRCALALLEHLDASLFREAGCWFGGGTAVSLRCGEYRLSRDVDLLCASHEGYRLLRHRVFQRGAAGLFAREVTIVRDVRADRYGIRLAAIVDDVPVKLEIVSEGRIELRGEDDPSLPVARLTDVDLVAEKLLANDDRYLDDGALGRDALDLLLLEHTLGTLPREAWEKARNAYGTSVDVAWARGQKRLRDDPARLTRWLDALGVLPEAREIVATKLATLARGDEGT